ncbi:hypothetical protein [Paenibacillus sp.]|jgi:outer membrane murein-binding lipoprotein Lpp|nr:hypothetical protein [Paenibacillus sp.]MDR0268094.1 hypothetical protein [Paenibacillus sp.]
MITRQTHTVVAAVLTFSILIVGCAEAKHADKSSNDSIKPPKGLSP